MTLIGARRAVRHAAAGQISPEDAPPLSGGGPVWQKGTGVVTVGVDTHKDAHVACARRLRRASGTASFFRRARLHLDGRVDARRAGASRRRASRHGRLRRRARPRARRRGRPRARGLGARPLRRRRRGKSDRIDAEQAARAASREPAARRRSRCAEMGALGALEAAYAGAVKARTAALNPAGQVVALPEEAGNPAARQGSSGWSRACASMRLGAGSSPRPGKVALRSLARRARMLDEEAKRRRPRSTRSRRRSPRRRRRSSGQAHHREAAARRRLNVSRLRSEASFSMLCRRARARLERQG